MTSPEPLPSDATGSSVALRTSLLETLRREIVEGQLAGGQRLNERELSERFGVSRVPVREALLRLETEGMVDIRPRQGARVAPLTRRKVRELFELRAALEPMAAHWSALRAQQHHIDDLNALIERARTAEREQDPTTGSSANTAFHEMLFLASGNEMLASLLPAVVGTTRRVFRLSILDHEAMMWMDHREILRAIEQGDAERAAALTSAHLEHTRRHTFELFDALEDAEGED